MPRKQQGWVTFQTSPEERELLEHYAQATQRSKTEVLRELVRNLSQSPDPEAVAAPSAVPALSGEASGESAVELPVAAVRVSARNQFRGKIKQLVKDGVNAEVVIELAPELELVAVITTRSANKLGLEEGKWVRAIVKSSNVMLAAD